MWPHGTWAGATTGAKAETERNLSGLRRASTRAPWPPMEWPKMPTRPASPGSSPVTMPCSSSTT
ncbi:Uncharacterised protein [Bordetella pertussis]|nr:Uncharacterised protein [Bordetella pertussis]